LNNKPVEIKDLSKFKNYISEIKYDGIRCMLFSDHGKLKLMRDDGNIKTQQFPEIINNISIPDGTTLDGELCYFNKNNVTDFYTILRRQCTDQNKIKILSKLIPCKFVAFDILRFQDSSMENEVIEDRKSALDEILKNQNTSIMKAQTGTIEDMKKFNLEGLVLKPRNSTYDVQWLKFKNYVEKTFRVTGFVSMTRKISALTLVNLEGKDVGKVNYIKYDQSDEMIKKINSGKLFAVVQFLPSTGKLRFPVLRELKE